jgi:phenylacetate-CoA ligase
MNSKLSNLLSRYLIDRRNGHRRSVLSAYTEKLRVSALPVEEREIYINHKLADLLNHARAHVPFWRQHIRGVVSATTARDVLTSLPTMDRAAIQSNRIPFEDEAMSSQSKIPNPKSKITEDATGGSSGTPMRFKIDRATQIARESSLYWADHLAGWNYGDRIAMLWGSDKDVKTAAQEAKLAFRWWIDNRRWYNAFNMGEDRMAEFHREMTRFRPHIIVAYAGSLDIYARFLQTKNEEQRTKNYPLTSIISSAEMLASSTRERAERVFGKPVFDRYGNREFGAIAAEDGMGGLRINPTDMILETTEQGELLVTYLANRAMPFIRYNTGDLTRLLDGGRMTQVTGRMSDTIRTASGKLIHGEYVTHLLYAAPRVREFQFIQESLTSYRLLLVADGQESDLIEQKLRRAIIEEVGSDSSVEIVYVDTIPVLSSGKRKFTMSRL